MTTRKNQTPGRKSPIVLIGLIAIVIVAAMAGVSAKYIQQTTKDDQIISSDFYFTSPMLSESGTNYTLAPSTTTLDILVCNYADDLRYSAKMIHYSYTVTKDDAASSVSNGTGTITGGSENASHISLENLTAGTYTVTVTSASPFKETLTGTFTIPKEAEEVHYSVTDTANSPFVLLTVWTDNYTGKVSLSWPKGVIPDSTNTQLQNVQTYSGGYQAGTVTITVDAYSSNVYRFFKENPSVIYDSNQLTAVKITQ